MQDLSEHLRHLFVVQTLGEVPDTFAVTAEHTDRLNAQADRFAQAEILRAIDLLARARIAVKDGAEPRIQLELALLKAVQPQADLSIQALLFRIEQLERRIAGSQSAPAAPETAPPAREASASSPPPPSPPPGPPAPRAAAPVAAGAPQAAAAAPQAVATPEEEPESGLDVELVRSLWPAAVDAVRAENAMVAALLGEARATALAGTELTVSFPEGAEFSRKKAEANRALLQTALRGLTGSSLSIVFDLSAPPPAEGELPPPMSEDELLDRLKAEFQAEEVFDDDDEGT
jgi:DNA polymerase-3 subunit gamma/tau